MAAVSIKKSIEGFFPSSASIQAQIIYRERNTQKWNSNNEGYVRKKPLRHEEIS